MVRGEVEPFVEEHPQYGRVYHVGDRHDMLRLLEAEHGLAWTSHPRIKASSWAPDIFRREDFYLSDTWLGAAWKSMPADPSEPRLGTRGLDLLDSMANWGPAKYLPGEVDVFKLDPTHELYGHMNVNYVKLDEMKPYDQGWEYLTDALKQGRFFVTTGEVLIRDFQVNCQESGQVIEKSTTDFEILVDLAWNFPIDRALIVWGDGTSVHQETVEVTASTAFGNRTLKFTTALDSPRWLRFEAWDVAGNGAFSMPVWVQTPTARP